MWTKFILRISPVVVIVLACASVPLVNAREPIAGWTSLTIEWLHSVSMITAADGWAVGESGSIIHWNGIQWDIVTSPTMDDLLSVDMVDASDG